MRYMSVSLSCGKTAWPERSPARKNSTGRKALPPKMSLTASWRSPSLAEARPVEISGRAVAAASTVEPKRIPFIPILPAMSSPLCSSATPATSVMTDATAKKASVWVVLIPLFRASRSLRALAIPFGTRWLPVLRPRQAHLGLVEQHDADHPAHEDEETPGRYASEDQRRRQLAAHDGHGEHEDDQRPFQHQRQGGGTVAQGTISPYAEGIDEDQHRRLDGDAAKDVAHGDTELSAEGSAGRDGDLWKVGDDGKEDQPPERLA